MKKDYQDTVRLDFSDNDLKRMIKALNLLKILLVSENAENNGNLSFNEEYIECMKMLNNFRRYRFEMLIDPPTDTNEQTD